MSNEQFFARSVWFTLGIVQVVFCILWAVDVINWHWAVVFSPLWMFLALPWISYFGVKFGRYLQKLGS